MSMLYWGAFPAFLARDSRAVNREAPGASAIVSSYFPMPWLAAKAAEAHGIRHVSLCFEPFPWFHDPEVISMYPAPKRALLAYLNRAFGRMDVEGIRRADELLTLNEATAAQMSSVYGRDDAVSTYAGVDTALFHPYHESELSDLRERLGPGPIAIHSTDFSPIKRTDLALEAFAVAARAVPEARLVVTSTREDPAQLQIMLSRAAELGLADRVTTWDSSHMPISPGCTRSPDALLQTGTSTVSGATTMSLPVKEALACGTPVVRSGAKGEDVEDGISGFLVDPLDSEDTGRKLGILLQDRDRGRQMGEAGRQRITARYSWDRVVDVVENALDAR